MSSKYVDNTAIIQIIGCVFNNPSLLDFTDKYKIWDEDFPDSFHKTVFGVIYNLKYNGANKITLETISDYLEERPKASAIYKANNGAQWIINASENANQDSFNYYYSRLKKMSLLRAYDNNGIDVSDLYDPDNIFDTAKKQFQEDWLDNSSLDDIADKIDKKIDSIRLDYLSSVDGEASQAGEGIEELINSLKNNPEAGVPLYGSLINTVTRGARLKKFYLRSAATGVGDFILPSLVEKLKIITGEKTGSLSIEKYMVIRGEG